MALRSSLPATLHFCFCHHSAFFHWLVDVSHSSCFCFQRPSPLLSLPSFQLFLIDCGLHSWGVRLGMDFHTLSVLVCVFEKSQILSWSGSLMGVGSSSAGTVLKSVRQVGHVAKVILTVSEVRPALLGLDKPGKFREYADARCQRGNQRATEHMHQSKEGEMESHDCALHIPFSYPWAVHLCAHAWEVYQDDTSCTREMCVRQEVCTPRRTTRFTTVGAKHPSSIQPWWFLVSAHLAATTCSSESILLGFPRQARLWFLVFDLHLSAWTAKYHFQCIITAPAIQFFWIQIISAFISSLWSVDSNPPFLFMLTIVR